MALDSVPWQVPQVPWDDLTRTQGGVNLLALMQTDESGKPVKASDGRDLTAATPTVAVVEGLLLGNMRNVIPGQLALMEERLRRGMLSQIAPCFLLYGICAKHTTPALTPTQDNTECHFTGHAQECVFQVREAY